MPNYNNTNRHVSIFEDQENQVPNARPRRNTFKESRIAADLPNIKNNTGRTVLGTLNTNYNTSNNLRVQPNRIVKQNVQDSFGSCSDENSFHQKTFSAPSFEIHSDSTESSFSSKSNILKPKQTKKTNKVFKNNKENEFPTLDANIASLSQLQRDLPISSPSPCTSPMMDVSICDDESMIVESPANAASFSSNSTPEDVLSTRDGDLYDALEYREEIYNYLREAEEIHKPRHNYMLKQTDITYSMRWILVDWLVEVSEEYNLNTETLYLAVSYIDRFLSQMSVKRDKLQLVGTTAMFIAAKYEEIYPPDVSQFAYITNNTYKVSQILKMEHLILKVLSFDMAVPTSHMFVSTFTKMNNCSEETCHLALFLAELSMLDGDPFLRFSPSLIAAASLALANHTQGKPVWPQHMVEATRYTLEDIKECYINLRTVFSRVREPASHAIRDKYKTSKYSLVSCLLPKVGFPWDIGAV